MSNPDTHPDPDEKVRLYAITQAVNLHARWHGEPSRVLATAKRIEIYIKTGETT